MRRIAFELNDQNGLIEKLGYIRGCKWYKKVTEEF
jgi:hypothetical protein